VVDVTTSIVIERPREQVAAYALDPANAPRWYANIDATRIVTPGPLAVGSQIEFHARFLGKSLNYTYEVVELVPGERLVMQTASGPFEMVTTYSWESLGPIAARITLNNRGRPSAFGGSWGHSWRS
jgi:uncharacterized protein YndB with AHSA1/START domain